MKDMKNNITALNGVSATLSGTTPAASSLVDMVGYESLTLVLRTGTVTDAGTADGFTVKLQHCDTTAAADFEDVDAADLVGAALQVTADGDDDKLIGTVGYIGNKRYVRAVATGTSGTNAVIQSIFIAGKANLAPPAARSDNTAAT